MVDPITAATVGSAAIQAGASLVKNFDNFLSLLTTQLKNQDPLEPMDSKDFTQQLVQFTNVEQAIATNKNLEKLLGYFDAGQAAGLVNYIGKQIEADGQATALTNGSATWTYDLPKSAARTVITITDQFGKKVFETTGETSAGMHTLTWDGKNSNGTQLPDGLYKINVSTVDSLGNALGTSTTINGKVSGVEMAEGEQYLLIGDLRVRLSDVRAVMAPPSI